MRNIGLIAAFSCLCFTAWGGSNNDTPTNLPPKVTISAPSGTDLGVNSSTKEKISISPVVDIDTTFTFEVTVTDNGGKTASVTYSLSVIANKFQAPQLTLETNYDVFRRRKIENNTRS